MSTGSGSLVDLMGGLHEKRKKICAKHHEGFGGASFHFDHLGTGCRMVGKKKCRPSQSWQQSGEKRGCPRKKKNKKGCRGRGAGARIPQTTRLLATQPQKTNRKRAPDISSIKNVISGGSVASGAKDNQEAKKKKKRSQKSAASKVSKTINPRNYPPITVDLREEGPTQEGQKKKKIGEEFIYLGHHSFGHRKKRSRVSSL